VPIVEASIGAVEKGQERLFDHYVCLQQGIDVGSSMPLRRAITSLMGPMLSKKGLRSRANSDSCLFGGRRVGDDGAAGPGSATAFLEFSLDEMIPTDHLLRRIDVFAIAVLADLHEQLKAFYSDIGRPSVDPELMIRCVSACNFLRAD
jgi:hypothetical protein